MFVVKPCLALLLFLSFSVTVRAASDREPVLLTHGDQTLQLNIGEGFNPDSHQDLTDWATHISNALLQVFGRWPRDRWRMVVEPASGSTSDPIPWGQVNRGPVDTVTFYVLPSASAEALQNNWTSYHELSHLLIPYKGSGDAWFSEGLASYYQNILQIRAGVLSEEQMWQKLLDGFMRGRQQSEFDGRPLVRVSDEMPGNGAFMRVYWSGAWYFLAADVQLRQQSGGRVGLDQALAALNRCCANESLSALAIAQRLDHENRVVLFEPLFQQARASLAVPDFETLYASLGIQIEEGQITLQDEGPGAELRQGMVKTKAL